MSRFARCVPLARTQHPRPQLSRKGWRDLNGLWDYAIRPRREARPHRFDGKILVPFSVESSLSGVGKRVGSANRLWYRREFTARKLEHGGRLLLHFGAVDWQAIVWVNGKRIGEHKGGYDPFTFDMTDALRKTGRQELVVAVWDPTDEGFQPRGKQVNNPRGIWYTSVTGIWQTVWLEPVPRNWIESLHIVPDIDHGRVTITVNRSGTTAGQQVRITVNSVWSLRTQAPAWRAFETVGRSGRPIAIKLPKLYLWSPKTPWLYYFQVQLVDKAQRTVDDVTSYFGMRKISLARGPDGYQRIFLNNKPLFLFGPLDQGWWPDGLYTAPTDAALHYDVRKTRDLGFNMIRKHVKIEPDRWYYYCDRVGILVWQDMPNGDRHIRPNEPDITRTSESARTYRRELKAIIDSRRNHPCIVVWVPFNEGWGQFETDRILSWVKRYDPTRLVDGPSGWADRGGGDLHDLHRYPGPAMPPVESKRAAVLGEFGGLGLPITGHLWQTRKNWGYRTYKTPEELRTAYAALIKKLQPLIQKGLAAAVYTQTTDVEGEVNGLMTYDREVVKMGVEFLSRMNRQVYSVSTAAHSRKIRPSR